MERLNGNGMEQAFPTCEDENNAAEGGFTKREYFAGLAMQGQLASMNGIDGNPEYYEQVGAKAAVRCADALLVELEKENPSYLDKQDNRG